MKKRLFLVFAALVAMFPVAAQESKGLELPRRDTTTFGLGFRLPDSLLYLAPWQREESGLSFSAEVKPTVPMSSVVLVRQGKLPARVVVLNNNTLRLGNYFNFSNGQAWNWGPFPNSFLDARTLSMPLPR